LKKAKGELMGIYDVPAKHLIEETAQKLKTEIELPIFTSYIKTGVHKERSPQREDWYYIRMGSILYRAYKWNVIGTEGLRTYYGGRQRRGLKTEHHRKASGKVVRSALQALEKAGYLERAKPKGRTLTGKGHKLLNEVSKITAKNIDAGKYKKVIKIVKEDAQAKAAKEELKSMDKKEHDHDEKKDKKHKKGDKK
jgi:small subunit ribosomal protein S19e